MQIAVRAEEIREQFLQELEGLPHDRNFGRRCAYFGIWIYSRKLERLQQRVPTGRTRG
jgi:hypothetical protein